MEKAAQMGEVYHLWWHPHNFGNNPSDCMVELRKILTHFKRMKETYGMESLNMENLGMRVKERVAKVEIPLS
jgi:hypothetical protein